MSGAKTFHPDWAEKVTLPVKRVGDRWEFFYGGDVPVKEGTLGDLTVETDQITDERFRQRVTRELTVKILDEGTPLLVALSDRSTNGAQAGHWPERYPTAVPEGTSRFERVTLGPPKPKLVPASAVPKPGTAPERGGLFLKLRGLERFELQCSTVRMPEPFKEPASSLNHAFTLLSQMYERHRISNTGNVYMRVFYQDRDGQWYPIGDLRNGVQAIGERKLLGELWAGIEQQLGWRPAPVVDKPRRRKP